MKRFETMMRQNDLLCWSLKALVTLVWLLSIVHLPRVISWVAKLSADTSAHERKMEKQIAPIRLKALIWGRAKCDRAHRMGSKYTPEVYFDDLAEATRLGYREAAYNSISHLAGQMFENSRQQMIKGERIMRARDSHPETYIAPPKPIPANVQLRWAIMALLWLLSKYLWTAFFAMLIFLLRMTQEEGIVETIFSDRRRFVLAILFWPWAFAEYPHSVIRRLNVEAEIRRAKEKWLGPLSRAEQRLVREIADQPERYKAWMAEHRPSGGFRWNVAMAVLVTIAIHLTWPMWQVHAEAVKDQSTSVAAVTCLARSGPTLETGQSAVDNTATAVCVLPEPLIRFELRLVARLAIDQVIEFTRRVTVLDHVPLLAAAQESRV